jgi:hypothetical protein
MPISNVERTLQASSCEIIEEEKGVRFRIEAWILNSKTCRSGRRITVQLLLDPRERAILSRNYTKFATLMPFIAILRPKLAVGRFSSKIVLAWLTSTNDPSSCL